MRARLARIPLLALILVAPAAAQAQQAAPPLVLLPLQGPESDTLTGELEQALGKVGRKVQRAALALDELMLAVECTEKSVACLQKIGGNLQAQRLVLGEVRKTATGLHLSLRCFDVATGGDAGTAEADLPQPVAQRAEAIAGAVRKLLGIKPAPRRPQEATGGLVITATVPTVEILLDGQSRGTTPLELRNLPVGRYRIEARVAEHVTWTGDAEVKRDQMTRLEIELEPLGARDRSPGYLDSIRLRTWLVAGAGLACIVTGAAFGAHMRAQQNEMDDIRGVTFEEIAQMEDLRDTGERDALAANILFGVGGAALLTAALLSYLDYRRARLPEASPPITGRTALHVGPTSVRVRIAF
jgi:hypothetical protein